MTALLFLTLAGVALVYGLVGDVEALLAVFPLLLLAFLAGVLPLWRTVRDAGCEDAGGGEVVPFPDRRSEPVEDFDRVEWDWGQSA